MGKNMHCEVNINKYFTDNILTICFGLCAVRTLKFYCENNKLS